MDNYKINKKTKIYLYGAASIGKIVLKNLLDYNIQGFIDMRGKEIQSMCGKTVYSLDNLSNSIDKKDIIIITVKNVFEHEEIAFYLHKQGYNCLIYKPKGALEGNATEHEEKLSNVWDRIVSGEVNFDEEDIPTYKEEFRFEFKDVAKIREIDGRIIANVPIELVYTNNSNGFWGDINIQALYPHISFFNYLGNKVGAEVESYVQFCEESAKVIGDIKITDAWKENVLRNRTKIYEQMCKALDVDSEFFIRSAPTADWNERGYFNLTSGKHRATFMVSKGKRYIPLSISIFDYEKWLKQEKCLSLKDYIIQKNIRETEEKILHPFYMEFPCSEQKFYTHFQYDILSFLCKKSRKENKRIRVATNLKENNSIYLLLKNASYVELVKEDADVVLSDQTCIESIMSDNRELLIITKDERNGVLLSKYIDDGKAIKLYYFM